MEGRGVLSIRCIVAIAASCAVFGLLCSAENVSAYTASITTSSSVVVNASPSGDGTSIHEESINVVSDCRSGYNLSIATPEGSNLYTNGDGSTTAVFTAVDGTSALNSTNNTNKWGYTLTTNPTSSTVFLPLSSTQSVLKTASQTASPSADVNDTFAINYGVKVDNSVNAGSYKMANNGSVVYYLTMNTSCTTYSVQYQGNGAENPNGMGTTDSSTGEKSVRQINIDKDTKITLLAPNFKRTGYSFLGWSTDSDAYAHFTDNDTTNDPIIYGPMEDVVIDSTIIETANSRNQINMYATWIPALKDGSNKPVYLQEWDNPDTPLQFDGCSTLTATTFDDTITNEKDKITVNKNSIVALTDKRDNEVYTVARLADGNCWMIENLRLEHEGTVGNNKNDTSVTNQSLSQGYGGTTGTYGNFVGLANPESANLTSSSTTANSIYKSSAALPTDTYDDNGTLEDIGTSNYPAYRFPRYNSNNTQSLIDSTTYTQNYSNASSPSDSGTNYRKSSNIYSYGNYYTWAAAMANTSYYTGPSTSEAAGTSICPSNWHLPSSGATTKEYGTLSQRYGGTGSDQGSTGAGDIMSNRFRSFPNNFLYSGGFDDSSVHDRGSYGIYWSRSSSSNSAVSYNLRLVSTVLYPSRTDGKCFGFSVRCLVGASDVQVTLDSNNGTGVVSKTFGAAGSTITLPSSSNPSAAVSKPSYRFKNWNTAPDGSGISYTSSYTIPANSTGEALYAQWIPQRQIIYNDNCSYNNAGCATSTDTTNTSSWTNAGSSITLGSGSYFTTRTGYAITSWNTARDGSGTSYNVSSSYTVPSTLTTSDQVTLYAQWSPQYTITYVNNCQTYASANTSCTTTVSNGTSEQKINLANNPSTGTETGTLGAYNKFALTGWKIKEWTTNADGTGTAYPAATTYTVPAGSSVGSGITLYAHWVPIYTVQYDGNGADNSSTGMGSTNQSTGIKTVAHTNVAEGDTFDLFASNFKKAGYGFVGWSTDSDAWTKLTDNDTLNDAKIWGPNEVITAPAYNGTPITTLYAIWAPAETSGGNPVYLQNWTGCSAMTATTYDTITGKLTVAKNSVTALTDERDGNVYTIAKLADENCWMVENLRLDSTPELSTTNTNIDSNNSTLPITNEYGSTTSNYLSATSSSWCFSNSAVCYDQSRLNTTNTIADITPSQTQNVTSANAHTDFNNTIYSYGNYYNWYSATAGYGTWSRSTNEPTAGDLCPAGWKLPYGNTGTSGTTNIGGTKGGFYYLASKMSATANNQVNSNKFRMFPNNFIYSGTWYVNYANARGSSGLYWSSSASGTHYAYLLYFYKANVTPGLDVIHKYVGYSVRCVSGS